MYSRCIPPEEKNKDKVGSFWSALGILVNWDNLSCNTMMWLPFKCSLRGIQDTELLTLSLRARPVTMWRKHISADVLFFRSLPKAPDHRWERILIGKSRASPYSLAPSSPRQTRLLIRLQLLFTREQDHEMLELGHLRQDLSTDPESASYLSVPKLEK